jgi:high-affinity iron transporter
MLAAAIIIFREVIEAGLIVGIVLAVTQGVSHRGLWISGGIIGGLLGACLVAIFAETLSNAMSGIGTELFNAGILAAAVCMLAWHNIWMARHGREMTISLRSVGQAVVAGSRSLSALAIVIGVAVLREGAEVVLFLYGVVVAEGSTGQDIFAGGMIGLALGVALSALTYLGLLRVPPKKLFAVTGTLIAFMAAGMAAQCVFFLSQAGVLTQFSQTLWDTSWILTEKSIFGRVLHTLLGYSDQPSYMQFFVYIATLVLILVSSRLALPAPIAPRHEHQIVV